MEEADTILRGRKSQIVLSERSTKKERKSGEKRNEEAATAKHDRCLLAAASKWKSLCLIGGFGCLEKSPTVSVSDTLGNLLTLRWYLQ